MPSSQSIATVFVLLLTLCAQRVQAQSLQDRAGHIRSAVDSADWQTALAELNALRSSNAAAFKANDYDYLLGRISERSGDVTVASASYRAVVNRNSLLSEYALWHLARFARATGDLVLERERLRQLVAGSKANVLHDAAVLRLADSFFESGDYSAAATAVRPLALVKNLSLSREAAALLGQSLLKAGNVIEAREVFTKLLTQMPDASRPDDFALAAVRALDALDAGPTDIPRLAPTEAERLLRASVYQFNRDFAGARMHYQAITERFPQSSTMPNVLYQLGRGLYLEGKYEEALKYFQKVLEQFADSASARDALSSLASSYSRLKRGDDAITTYKLFIERFPDAPNPERPYLNIIDALHEAGHYTEALSWVRQTRARFKGDIGSALALFAQIRIHLAQGYWKEAVADADELLTLSDLGGARVAGGTSPAEVTFLRGYALEQMGRVQESIATYLSIPDGRNEYYGTRATRRLLGLSATEGVGAFVSAQFTSLLTAAKTATANGQSEQARLAAQSSLRLTDEPASHAEALKILQAAYAAIPAYRLASNRLVPLGRQDLLPNEADASKRERTKQQIADDLLFLGLYDEAMPEFFAARAAATSLAQTSKNLEAATATTSRETSKASAAPADYGYTVAVYSLRGGLPNRAVRFAEQFWKSVPSDYVLELAPRELAELLYPVPFRESLLKHAPNRNVDPRFVLSIARQESRYQADAKSVAAARGMMQFISSTASETAGQLGQSNFNQDDLYDPDTAILFGSQYLSSLLKKFPDQHEAAAAAYNSGDDNVARWIARSRSKEADRYVPEIGFPQTKDYVFRVMTNFWNYQQLYDGQLKAQSSPTK